MNNKSKIASLVSADLRNIKITSLRKAKLTGIKKSKIRSFLEEVFGPSYSEDHWNSCQGGIHTIAQFDGKIIGHTALIPRSVIIDNIEHPVKYVEAVAVDTSSRNIGLGKAMLQRLNSQLELSSSFALLTTTSPRFYQKLGWSNWIGRSWTHTDTQRKVPPGTHGQIMYFAPTIGKLSPQLPISINWRPGDIW